MLAFGELLADQGPDRLTITAARAAAAAVGEHRDFTLLELRGDAASEMLVVECRSRGIFSQNAAGIKYREPLSLRFFRDPAVQPEVRALRSDFPVLLHENRPEPGEPKWLCIYYEPWSQIRRSWTPQRFLARIQWWLENSAAGTLHPTEQPPEQLYYQSAYTIVLPQGFDDLASKNDLALELEVRSSNGSEKLVAVAKFKPLYQLTQARDKHFTLIALNLNPIVHTSPELPPPTLGELDAQLAARQAPIAERLFKEVQRIVIGAGLVNSPQQKTLLILTVPIVNPNGGAPRIERSGFLIDVGMGQLGVMAGALALDEKSNKYVVALQLGGQLHLNNEWRAARIIAPVEIRQPFSEERARAYSGVEVPGPEGVLAGVGALGSAMADVWAREGWGRWSYVDNDLLFPHNLARHRGYEHQVGLPKVEVICQIERAIYQEREPRAGVRARANDFTEPNVLKAMQSAQLIVDATTTLEVPRDLAKRADVGRSTSVFITPSGSDAVMLLEDAGRQQRLDVLEAQYYRHVLNAPWAAEHLKGHQGSLWVGAGCRDISLIISGELVQAHAALLARQIRLRCREQAAHIQVWRANPGTGEVRTTACPVAAPLIVPIDGIELVWDEGVRAKVRGMREDALPSETGGVLLGYFDLVNHRVYVVDALPAPADSLRGRAEFARGAEGLQQKVEEALERTAHVVGYIGEWHSHPRGVAPDPSRQDIRLLVHLALMLRQDGLPVLMLIVGEADEQWLVGAAGQP